MARKAFNQWKIETNQFNKTTVFYVACDCGELAQSAFPKHYFECKNCGKRYIQHLGEYIEMKK